MSPINRPHKVRHLVLAGLGAVIVSLSIAGSAQASDLDVDLICEPIGNYQIMCETFITGGDHVAIDWTHNGLAVWGSDDQFAIVVGCNPRPNLWHEFAVIVSPSDGPKISKSHMVRCLRYAP